MWSNISIFAHRSKYEKIFRVQNMKKSLGLKILWFTIKQKSYKCDNQLITWLTGITRPDGSCNLVTLKTNFAQYKNFVCYAA